MTDRLRFVLKDFLDDQSGAVTVDWVVLTAALVGLGIAVVSTIGSGTSSVASDVGSAFSGATVTLTLPTY